MPATPIIKIQKTDPEKAIAILVEAGTEPQLSNVPLSAQEQEYIQKKIAAGVKQIFLHKPGEPVVVQVVPAQPVRYKQLEEARKAGDKLQQALNEQKIAEVQLLTFPADEDLVLAFAEGMALANYRFLKYKSGKEESSIRKIMALAPELGKQKLVQLNANIEGTCIARDLVNEPVIFLSAEELSKQITAYGNEAGYKTEVLRKPKLQSLKMGGLLAVNAGSQDPPTFNILEYKPKKAVNKQPVVLIGKGVVYDTGGLSLKPTAGSMDSMKSDMAGSAAVVGTLYSVAKSKLPLHVIGLIPATDNRPGEKAITPGDVITMFDGQTVEVLNTDAEGRLILADALTYAKRYEPSLVIDLATLTGAAHAAVGHYGIVVMGTANSDVKKALEESGRRIYERLVEFPIWDEYDEMLESDIADMKNIGGSVGGAITAGMFLKKFTDFPWIHMDIAGPAFLTKKDSYRGKNGTGAGVRLLCQYLQTMAGAE
ncbi:MAG: leucyl aminopeptidase [Bacteroidia bacterium]